LIAEIGLMIGFYIITRMISILLRKGERQENAIVIVFAAITILITLFVVYDLFTRGANLQALTR